MISVIVPCYNEAENISACLSSIRSIDFPAENYEIILVDNGSTDHTVNIAKKFNPVILKDADKNISGLRNLGAQKASGEILAFVDADCIVTPQWLKKASQYAGDRTIAAWGAPPVIPPKATWVQKAWYLIRQKENKTEYVDWLESMNLFVKKEYFNSVGGFNESLVTCEDVDFCFRIREHGKILSDPDIVVIHMGEAATVLEFFKKEFWRGQSNLSGLVSHGFRMSEMPSLLLPVYFGLIFLFLLGILLLGKNVNWFLTALILYLLPTIAVFYRKRRRKKTLATAFGLLGLLQVYFWARTFALFNVKRMLAK